MYFIFKMSLHVWSLHHWSQPFMEKPHTGYFGLVHGTLVDKQQ